MTANNTNKIVKVELKPVLKFAGKVARYAAMATVEGEEAQVELFRFYTDEKYYTNQHFIGMTVEEARQQFVNDDIKYLQTGG